MTLVLIVSLPLLGAAVPLVAARWGRDLAAVCAGMLTASSFALLVREAGAVLAGETLHAGYDWIPSLGWNATFMLDGLGLLFAGLILGIGLLIVLYARYYLPGSDRLGRFYCYLLLFMGSMLGIVLADNMILLVAFWELTSISSFLLIGYWSQHREGREGARMALAVTGAGGLALLGGVLVLGAIAGSYELSVVLGSRFLVQGSSWYWAALGLILLGAFTKSAQFPFHFWLPHAMAAPTPVSAYLHSATMVKAGIFLLARLSPIFAGSPGWLWLVGGTGLLTMVLGAWWAIHKTDLKALLAYSTVSHLGMIVMLLGFGTAASAVAAVFHVLNHAAFKAALFMTAGIVDHEAGTRDLRRLGGLRTAMPVTTVLAALASAAMAGVPPLNGFVSKEMAIEDSLHVHLGALPAWFVPGLVTVGALFGVAYSLRLVAGTFFGPAPESWPKAAHEPPRGMRLPVTLLVIICVLIGLFPAAIATPLVAGAADAVVGTGEPPEVHLALWHGFGAPLLLSALAIVGGVLLYRAARGSLSEVLERGPHIAAKDLYDGMLMAFYAFSGLLTRKLQNGSLQQYLVLLMGTALVFGAWPFLTQDWVWLGPLASPADAVTVVAWLILVVATIGVVVLHRRRVVALVLLGVVGLVVTLGFVHFSAPDLALTQVSVEFVTIVMILLALHLLPKSSPPESSGPRRVRDLTIAGLAGAGVGVITWAVLTRPLQSISEYYMRTSVPEGGGHNVVNVILVDFRGFDTFGEISVLAIAALGIYAMVDGLGIGRLMPERGELQDEDQHPLILSVVATLLLPLALMVSVFLFLRGHNLPGGGFIAALVTSVAIIVQYVAFGVAWTHRRLPAEFRPLVAVGLLIAGLTGMAAWAWGLPFLTSTFGHFHLPWGDVELASAAAFDLGVYLTVVGAVLLVLANMSKMGRREELLELQRERAAFDVEREVEEHAAATRRVEDEGEV